MENEKLEIPKPEENEFVRMVRVIRESESLVPSQAIIEILSSIVLNTGKDSERTKEYVEILQKDGVTDDAEKVSRIVLYTCNSFILSLWNTFGEDFKKIYKLRLEKKKAELDAELEKEKEKPQA